VYTYETRDGQYNAPIETNSVTEHTLADIIILNFRDGVAKLFDASRPLSALNRDRFKEMK